MAQPDSYFMYFPGNYRWSAAFINMLGSAPYGGSDIGELHKIGRLLKGKAPEDDDAWFDACAQVADGVRARYRSCVSIQARRAVRKFAIDDPICAKLPATWSIGYVIGVPR